MKADNKYISYLDGFRGYSILFVLLGHFELARIYLSRFGVTVFFFVSGFLITKLLIHEFERSGKIQLRDFYLRRIFRLYPALIFMLLSVIIILTCFGFPIVWWDISAGMFYFTNYYLVFFKPVVNHSYLLVSNILWSLSVEEHFYFAFPVLFAVFYRRPAGFLRGLVISLIIFLAIRMVQAWNDPEQAFPLNYFLTHSRGDSIVYGCVAALLMYRFNTDWYLRAIRSRGVMAAAVVVLVASFLYRDAFFQNTLAYSLQGLGFFFLIPGFAFIPERHWTARLVNNQVIVFLGRLCYSLYLFHWVSLKMVSIYHPAKDLGWYLQVVPLTFVLSLVSFYLVEKPFLKLRKRFGSNAKA